MSSNTHCSEHNVESTASPSSKPGQFSIANRYTVLSKLGAGSFGAVFKAKDKVDGTIVAIKIIEKQTITDEYSVESLEREKELLLSLRHPNLVSGIHMSETAKRVYMVMEYVDGSDLYSYLEKKKRIDEEEAKHLFRQLLECLEYLHEEGVAHRDLKIENLLLTSDGTLKVCDLGLASCRPSSPDTLCETLVGTEDYTCPEIIHGVPYDGQHADMWSAGVVLFVLLAGYCPFYGWSGRDRMKKTVSCKFKFPRNFPSGAKEVVNALLRVDGKERLSASEALQIPWVNPGVLERIELQDQMSPLALEISSSPLSCNSFQTSQTSASALSSRLGYSPSSPTDRSDTLPPSSRKDVILANATLQSAVPRYDQLIRALFDPKDGVSVRNRTWRFRVFLKCFLGKEAVTCIASYLNCSRGDAVKAGQVLMDFGAFHHICRHHKLRDEFLFYQWNPDDPYFSNTLNFTVIAEDGLNSLDAKAVSRGLLKELFAVCESHVNERGLTDIRAVHQDSFYRTFCVSTRQLQAIHLNGLGSEDDKRAFFVNLHNLMWLHARLSLGIAFCSDDRTIEDKVLSFSYVVAGTRITLQQINEMLLPQSSSPKKSRLKLPPTPKTGSILRPSGIFGGQVPTVSADARMVFLTSDYTFAAPKVEVVDSGDVTAQNIKEATHRYLATVLILKPEARAIHIPKRIALYREMMSLHSVESFIRHLTSLLEGSPLADGLQQIQQASAEGQAISVREYDFEDRGAAGNIWLPWLWQEY